MLKKVLLGNVTHEVKVTKQGKGYLISVLTNGEENQKGFAKNKSEIGAVARDLLRMEDKCGNCSKYAHSARMRQGRKEAERIKKEKQDN